MHVPFNCVCTHRIQDVVGKACVITWSKKIYTQLINYVGDTIKRIDSMCSNETEKKDSKYIYCSLAKEGPVWTLYLLLCFFLCIM